MGGGGGGGRRGEDLLHRVIVFVSMCLYQNQIGSISALPRYNCSGWLGVKHQVTCLTHLAPDLLSPPTLSQYHATPDHPVVAG